MMALTASMSISATLELDIAGPEDHAGPEDQGEDDRLTLDERPPRVGVAGRDAELVGALNKV